LSSAAIFRAHFEPKLEKINSALWSFVLKGAVMSDDLRASDLSSPATNGSSGDSASALSVPAVGQAFAGADEKELSTVAKRFLIAEINRLVEETQQLKQFKEKYHELDKKIVVLEKFQDLEKKLIVLKETNKPFRRNLFLSSACLIAGSAGVAAAPSFLSINQYGWYVFVSVSAMLLIAGIAARVEGPSTASK
jgi:hypothetical protein